jgi:pimeloyl-ACP methyl ester carboxylesterase
MSSPPIILVPGFWLGAWAWDEVAATLRADGHARITFSDHVDAICDAVTAAGRPVVLAVHSGAGAPGYAATDRLPDRIAAMVYVDSGPATGPLDPDFDAVDKPLASTWEELGENLDGISEEQLETFRRRAVPEPGDAMRGRHEFKNDARLDIPSTAICTAFSSDEYKKAIEAGYDWLAGFADLRNLTYVDLPTSHWPMWSRPQELAAIIADIARRASN